MVQVYLDQGHLCESPGTAVSDISRKSPVGIWIFPLNNYNNKKMVHNKGIPTHFGGLVSDQQEGRHSTTHS